LTRKTQGLIAIAATVAVGALAPAASGRATFETSVDISNGTVSGNSFLMVGSVFSEKRKCEGGRTVKLLVRPKGETKFKVVDTDRSSRLGAWATRFPFQDTDGQKIQATKKKLRNGDVCKADGQPFEF